jgi:beta-galactosidase
MAPTDSEFEQTAKWVIAVRRTPRSDTISNVFLRIAYTGDVGRLSVNGDLLEDNFYNGLPWMIGLKRFGQTIEGRKLELSILPLRKDAPIFLDMHPRPSFVGNGQIGELESMKLIPQYKFQIQMEEK